MGLFHETLFSLEISFWDLPTLHVWEDRQINPGFLLGEELRSQNLPVCWPLLLHMMRMDAAMEVVKPLKNISNLLYQFSTNIWFPQPLVPHHLTYSCASHNASIKWNLNFNTIQFFYLDWSIHWSYTIIGCEMNFGPQMDKYLLWIFSCSSCRQAEELKEEAKSIQKILKLIIVPWYLQAAARANNPPHNAMSNFKLFYSIIIILSIRGCKVWHDPPTLFDPDHHYPFSIRGCKVWGDPPTLVGPNTLFVVQFQPNMFLMGFRLTTIEFELNWYPTIRQYHLINK